MILFFSIHIAFSDVDNRHTLLYLCLYFVCVCACWVFVSAPSSLGHLWALSSLVAEALWAWAQSHVGSVVPKHVGSVPRSGTEPVSPALEGKFLTTGPPGKSLSLLSVFLNHFILGKIYNWLTVGMFWSNWSYYFMYLFHLY